MRVNLSVVVPTFNEERRIAETVRAILAYLPARYPSFEVIVSDDGSGDGTRRIVTGLIREGCPITLLAGGDHRGKGHAVRRGVLATSGDLVLVTDADAAIPIQQVERLAAAITRGSDIVIGSRRLDPSRATVRPPGSREVFGWIFNLLVQATILRGIWDTQCGFKLFRGPVARRLFPRGVIDGFAFDVEILSLAARSGYAIREVPVEWSHVSHSSVRLIHDGASMLRDLTRIVTSSRYPAPPHPQHAPGVHQDAGENESPGGPGDALAHAADGE